MHAELARALAPVVSDLEATGGPVVRVVDEDWVHEPGYASATLWDDDDSHGAGVSVRLGLARSQQVADVADQVQDWAFDELWGTTATNWPPCPHHPTTHPMRAALVDGAARWTCPRDGTAVAVVGTLR